MLNGQPICARASSAVSPASVGLCRVVRISSTRARIRLIGRTLHNPTLGVIFLSRCNPTASVTAAAVELDFSARWSVASQPGLPDVAR